MPLSPYVARVRRLVGQEVLLLPSVTVVPKDADRLLLIRETDSGEWGTIGGTIEIDESPRTAAVREAREEAGIDIAFGNIFGVVGGPEYQVEYPNGDRCSYVAVVFEAEIVAGSPTPDGKETNAARWFGRSELVGLNLNSFARSLFAELGILA